MFVHLCDKIGHHGFEVGSIVLFLSSLSRDCLASLCLFDPSLPIASDHGCY